MIQCSGCDKWAHLVCFGYSSPTDPSIPPIHVCYKCRNSRSSNNKNKYNAATCDEEVGGGVGGDGNTSSTINEFYDLDKASEVALYRRCLSVVWNEGLLNSTWLASRLGNKLITFNHNLPLPSKLLYPRQISLNTFFATYAPHFLSFRNRVPSRHAAH